jgi:molybdopterin-binding protein
MMRVEMDCGFRLAALLTKQACDELVLRRGDRVVTLIKAPNIHLISR